VTTVRRRCACQQYLEADPRDSEEVVAAVVRDQKTAQHRDWWHDQQIIDEKVRIPVLLGATAKLRRIA
jgi:hypothetical protein